MEVDIVIKNANLVSSVCVKKTGIAINKGVIVAIAEDQNLPYAKKVIDAQGNYVLPGAIDEHVHLLDMGMKESGDFEEGSRAAAAGGVTTVMEMPLTIPATTTYEAFLEKKEVASKKFIVDYALYGGVVPGNIDQIPKLAEAGAIGFKAMMAGSVPGLFEILDDGMLLEAFRAIADCNSVIALHAENDSVISNLEAKLKLNGRKDIQAFFESRPIINEIEAISTAIMFATETGCKLHILHVGCPQGIDLINQKRGENQFLTCESGPQYLALTQEDARNLGPYIKFAPPVRSKLDVEKLWQQLAEGKIDTLGSDHGPHKKESKEKGWENIWEAGNGALGIETILPVMLSEGVNKGRISIQNLVSVICENPAKIFGIFPKKGIIKVGSDADIVIVDMQKEFVVKSENFHTKIKHSPFEGFRLKGKPVLTMVRGEIVMEDGIVTGKPGYGKLLTPCG